MHSMYEARMMDMFGQGQHASCWKLAAFQACVYVPENISASDYVHQDMYMLTWGVLCFS